jgi:glutamate racemase
MWVPLIENGEHTSTGADYFVKKYLDELLNEAPGIDTLLLACTHYPLIANKIKQYLPQHVQVVAQGDIVATSLADYLTRHPEMDKALTRGGTTRYYTTDDTTDFDNQASVFLGKPVTSTHVSVATLQR